MIENNIISDELWNLLDDHLHVSLPRYRINEYLAYLSKTLLMDYENENNKVIAKVLLSLRSSFDELRESGEPFSFHMDELMALETKSFNALVMVVLFHKRHKTNTESYFGNQFVEMLRALYLSP